MFAVSSRSFTSGSIIDKNNPLFIFEASKTQLEIPTKATCSSFFISSYSNNLCSTFSGLFFDSSASPSSSKYTKEIIFSFPFSPITIFFALSKTNSIPCEVDVFDPWKDVRIILG